jgi:hypothetical protein
MLRYAAIAVIFGALLPLVARAVAANWGPPWFAPVVWLILALCAFLFERQRYNPEVQSVTGAWLTTGEKFVDPTTGEPLQVYVNSETGERQYKPI